MLTTTCMCRPYIDTNNPQGMKLRRFKNRTPARFEVRVHLLHLISIMLFKLGHVSIPKRSTFSPLFLFCSYDSSVLQNFKISTHSIFRIVPFVDGSRYKINGPLRPLNSECITSKIGSEKYQKCLRILFWRNILKS